ncbi:MAG TPA: anthranilate synthase component I, partial [Elusimicrobia bacterium]|nr:anthranilate synthase component I [Elusimicrobiota bacterium]
MFYPNKKKFEELIKNGYTVQLWKEIPVGGETPVSAYLKLGANAPSCLLESVEGEKKFARYSFLVLSPSLVFESRDKFVKVKTANGKKNIKTDDPLEYLKSVLSKNKILHDKSLPRLSGGAIG